MKDYTAPLFLVIGLSAGVFIATIAIQIQNNYESELVGKGQMQALHEIKRMCDGRLGTPNLLLDSEFYYCIENTAQNRKRFFK